MARFHITNRFSVGWVSPALAAHTQWDGWTNCLTEAENVVLPPKAGPRSVRSCG